MIIITGYTLVDADHRDEVVAAFRDLVRRARAFDGCIDLAISADAVDPQRINNLELFEDAEALDEWRGQSDSPDLDVEFEDVVMRRLDATDGGPLFP